VRQLFHFELLRLAEKQTHRSRRAKVRATKYPLQLVVHDAVAVYYRPKKRRLPSGSPAGTGERLEGHERIAGFHEEGGRRVCRTTTSDFVPEKCFHQTS